MYEHILVPTDGSAPASEAVERAIDVARKYDARLTALYVVNLHDVNAISHTFETSDLTARFEEEGEAVTADVVERARSVGVTAEAVVVEGVPHETILSYAAENDVDLVVMGTHGRTGIDRYLLGSVTEKVIRLSDVPVLAVRQQPPAE